LFPLPSNSFDSALCNQVLEHVFNPDEFLSEIYRVLKPTGKMLLTVPFVWDEHEQPYDYARYSSFGLKSLLEKNGFHVLDHKKIGADVTIIFQLINAYIFKVIQKWPRLVRLILTVSLMALFNILGLILGWLLPKNEDLFLDQIILVEKR
jgi:SAM-dependent methyltransferase